MATNTLPGFTRRESYSTPLTPGSPLRARTSAPSSTCWKVIAQNYMARGPQAWPRSGDRMQPTALPELAEGAQALGKKLQVYKPRGAEEEVGRHLSAVTNGTFPDSPLGVKLLVCPLQPARPNSVARNAK